MWELNFSVNGFQTRNFIHKRLDENFSVLIGNYITLKIMPINDYLKQSEN